MITPSSRLLKILDSIDAYFYSLDANWNFIYVSKRMANDFGFEKEQLLGKNFWVTFPKFVGTEVEKNFTESLEKCEVRHFEWQTLYFKGSFREFTVFPFADGITVYGKDITKRKKAEQALEESEKLYRTLFDNSQDGFQIIELIYDDHNNPIDFRYLKINIAYEKIIGVKASDIIGKKARDVFPNYEAKWLEIPYNVVKTGMTAHLDSYTCTVNKWLDLYYFPYGDNKVGTVFRDITQRKNAEEALKQSQDHYRQLFNSMSEYFCVIELVYDLQGKPIDWIYLEVNPATERFFAKRREQIIGKRSTELFGKDGLIWLEQFSRVSKTGKTETVEQQGAVFNGCYRITAWRLSSNQIAFLSTDITETKNLERQLKEKERLATIGQTAGMVGHDIRNPLQAIVNELYLAKESMVHSPESILKQEALSSLNFVQEQIDYINKIVADLQDYARDIQPSYSKVDLASIIDDVFSSTLIPKNIEIKRMVELNLMLETDPSYIRRIITNLATNAIQAMPNGGKLIIKIGQKANFVEITVSDTGEGIPENLKDKVFKPLFTTKAKGQGFGLAVVKKFAEQLGGTITFESQEGKGTTFKIELPVE